MKKDKTKKESCCRIGKVGGEAVIEGVMMRSGDRYAVACRREDGGIEITEKESVSVRKKYKILNIPIIRGIVGMIESLILSFKSINIAAEAMGLEEGEPSKFEKWLDRHFGKSIIDIVMVIASVLGVGIALVLFMWLPALAAKGIESLIGAKLGGWKTLIEGVIKIAIFIAYLCLVSLMKDIRRTFEYHGAEHKSIFCYEAGVDLTPENAAKFKRFHPRCGTAFLFVALTISIIVFSVFRLPWDNTWLRLLVKLPLVPLIVGIGFEFIMLTGKHDNWLTRILTAPGLWMQRITTREPDFEQLEIAIAALKSAMPDEFPEFAAEHEQKEAELRERLNAESTDPADESDIPEDSAESGSTENANDDSDPA